MDQRLAIRIPRLRYSLMEVYLDGAHLVAVRGLSTKKFQPECVNEESSTERLS